MISTNLDLISIECQICIEDYDSVNKKPMVLDCGHTICKSCLIGIFQSSGNSIKKCPFDNAVLNRNVNSYPVNWIYIDIINHYKRLHKPLKEYQFYKEYRNTEGYYTGQTEANFAYVRHGLGKMQYNDGSFYEGNWKKDKRNGKGKFVHPDKKEYEGEWEDDLPHGYGKYVFNIGEIKHYEGNWRRGKFFGFGKITYADNSELETIFVDGLSCCDFVKMNTADNRMLIGHFENDRFIGKGYEISPQGDVYIGFFDNEKIDEEHFSSNSILNSSKLKKKGNGVIHFKDGSKYEGSFDNNQMNGFGIFYYIDGSLYEGEFMNDLKNGKGIMTYSNGDLYNGEWFNGVRNGFGMLKKKSGEVYRGDWSNDKKHGKGKIINENNGYSYEGDWIADKKHGKAVEIFPDQESYYGDFINGLKDGKGLFVFKNGDTYKGDWLNDKMHGLGCLITSDGEEINAKWSNGLIVKEAKTTGKVGDKKDKNCIIY